ncbi:DUF927 domain-containing protein [Bradyrhizobium sp. NBAIM14]|uniref:DUF927 domain-containing protein n=1 Tax=Bradyrhizobium sp. NBAIM14 TaxID=2793814 RepID=UPI001CD7E958|nr:DUF927 domain-containing protein [Bradyrhizobium sp. NBAIM14]MCA1500856.1 DUF927 domain-containing protein [Bradyrhizobium sp. NBAIM14]
MNEHFNFAAVKAAAMGQLSSLVIEMLPNGRREGDEWVAINPTRSDEHVGSFKVNLKTGLWKDFAVDERGGDVISLYAYLHGVSQLEAMREVARKLGVMAHTTGRKSRPEDIPIIPVPTGAPTPNFEHPRYGQPTSTWTYLDASGNTLGFVARFDVKDGKQVLPLTFCRLKSGRNGWSWKSFRAPRPLYGLRELAERPDAGVLMVEGEKTADAARVLFPDATVVTWPGGASAVRKVDWSPLQGRRVVIWPDNDQPGIAAGEAILGELRKIGAADVRVIKVPEGLDKGWDLADPVPEGIDLQSIFDSRGEEARAGAAKLPTGFYLSPRGIEWLDPTDDEGRPVWISAPIEVLAETRDVDGQSWGVLLRWRDNDGAEHTYALPRSTLAGDGVDARRILIDGGYTISESPKARSKFNSFLLRVRSDNRARAVPHIGWHNDVFVLPDQCFGSSGGETYLHQSSFARENPFRQAGSLAEWQQNVARLAAGNSRLMFAISAALAAALLHPLSAEPGGFHFRGPSSIGKTSALLVGASLWGGGPNGYTKTWRATANGLEGVAAAHTDTLLTLDEMSQVSSREAGEAAYLLANGQGKQRSGKDGSARRQVRFRTLFLSSGEISLADKLAEDGHGRKPAAGQQVRIVDIEADAGANLGLFEDLHEFDSPEAFARHLRSTTSNFYGCAARAFLEVVTGDLDNIRDAVREHMKGFTEHYVPKSADGQVERVAQRFALVAAAGEIAAVSGIVPWPAGEASSAAARCFGDWMTGRGGIGDAETATALKQIRKILLGEIGRFVPAWDKGTDSARLTQRDILGYRKQTQSGGWDFYCTVPAWDTVLCLQLDAKRTAEALAKRGFLLLPNDGRLNKVVSVPGFGKVRVYHILSHLVEDDGDA